MHSTEIVHTKNRYMIPPPVVFLLNAGVYLLLLVSYPVCVTADKTERTTLPVMAGDYLPLIADYAVYAKTIWHDEEVVGYWGGGIAEKDMNGSIRGTNNVMVGYALLAYATEQGWLNESDQQKLLAADLDREGLVRYIKKNLAYISGHHISADTPLEPTWGNHWQSSLWLGTTAVSALLVWDDLDEGMRGNIARMMCPEADRITAKPPKDYNPGDTGAEENGWDTHVLAAAIVLNPEHPNREQWWNALCRYAVNTYSIPADKNDTSKIGTHRVNELVTTANFFKDFTTENHSFFHPGYLKVSGQELGEAWMILALADRRFNTKHAEDFEPYSLHNVAPVWREVLRYLLLPDGEFVFPNGQDWTFHTSSIQAYFAWIATALGDPLAMRAEQRGIQAAQRRHRVAEPGRIFDESNLAWWWEPLLVKRITSALLLHMLRPAPEITTDAIEQIERGTWTRLFPKVRVWLHRNPDYFATVSWGRIHIGTMTPLGTNFHNHPYMTLPTFESIVPDDVNGIEETGESGDATIVVLGLTDGRRCALVCLPHSTVWISPVGFRPIGIENDRLTGKGRTITSAACNRFVPALSPMETFDVKGAWLNIDNRFGHIATTKEYRYVPAGGHNRRSAAVDTVVPEVKGTAVWQMIPSVTEEETAQIAKGFHVEQKGDRLEVDLIDGPRGAGYTINARLGEPVASFIPLDTLPVGGNVSSEHPLEQISDKNPATFTVIRNVEEKGPTTDCPVHIYFAVSTEEMTTPTLVITPRPNYGPRAVEIFLRENDAWKTCGEFDMTHKTINIPIPAGREWRLTITGTYDWGNRNVQIAELYITDGIVPEPVTEPAPLSSISVKKNI